MSLLTVIPEQYKKGFQILASLEDREFESIKEALALTSLVSSFKALAKKVQPIEGELQDKILKMFLSVGSLVKYLESENQKNEFVSDISNLALEDKLIENEVSFKERMSFLIDSKQIYYASKAKDLTSGHGNVFLESKILTDIRPVFGIDVDSSPIAGMVFHHLHLHFRADHEAPHKDLYLTLDSNDLTSLKEAIERAEKKEYSLQSVFKNTGMTNLND